jgi:hypothetical protein
VVHLADGGALAGGPGLNKRDNVAAEPPSGHPDAIVRPHMAERRFTVERLPPRRSLAELVDYYWPVRWDVPASHRQRVVPQPRVHVAAEGGRLLVHGVTHKPFFRTRAAAGLAAHAGMSLRSLQRLFTDYVGVGPKWVILLPAGGGTRSNRRRLRPAEADVVGNGPREQEPLSRRWWCHPR